MTLNVKEFKSCKKWIEQAFKRGTKQKCVLLKCMADHRDIFCGGAELNTYNTYDKYFEPFFMEVGLDPPHTRRNNFCSGGNWHTTWALCPFIKKGSTIWVVKKEFDCPEIWDLIEKLWKDFIQKGKLKQPNAAETMEKRAVDWLNTSTEALARLKPGDFRGRDEGIDGDVVAPMFNNKRVPLQTKNFPLDEKVLEAYILNERIYKTRGCGCLNGTGITKGGYKYITSLEDKYEFKIYEERHTPISTQGISGKTEKCTFVWWNKK